MLPQNRLNGATETVPTESCTAGGVYINLMYIDNKQLISRALLFCLRTTNSKTKCIDNRYVQHYLHNIE